jgi:hypothetical protein
MLKSAILPVRTSNEVSSRSDYIPELKNKQDAVGLGAK